MGGSSGQTQSSGPPRWMVPYIQDVMGQAKGQYYNYTPQYFPDSTVAPQSGYTQSAISQMGNYGSSPTNTAATGAATSSLTNLAGASQNPLYTAGANMLPQNLQYLTGVQNSTPTQVENAAQSTGGNTTGAINSQLTVAPGSSPYIDELVQRALQANTRNFSQQALPQIDNASQMTGGYGGTRQGVAQGVALQGLANANADTAAQLYSGQYNADLNRQLQAAGLGANLSQAASSAQLARTGQGLTATGQGLDLASTGLNYGLDASKAAGLLAPSLQQMGIVPIQAQGQAGTAQDQYSQALVQDAMNRWNFQQDLPYNQLNQYANLVGGGAGSAGTQQTTNAGGFSGVGAVGGAAAGLGAYAMAVGASNAWNPVGWGIMAAGALLGSGLFG